MSEIVCLHLLYYILFDNMLLYVSCNATICYETKIFLQ